MPDILYREIPLAESKREMIRADDGTERMQLTLIASSETPVMRYGDKEILAHGADNVRLDRLRTVGAFLINHDRDQRVGSVESVELKDSTLVVRVLLGTTERAKVCQREVEDGSLRSVSIGYNIYHWDEDNEARTYTAVDWEPFEVSLVSIAADPSAMIARGDQGSESTWKQLLASSRSIVEANKGAPMPNENNEPEVETSKEKDEAKRAQEIAAQRVEAAERKAELMELALRHQINTESIDFDTFDSRESGYRALMDQLATQNATQEPKSRVQPAVITDDEVDKVERATENWLTHRVGFEQAADGNPLAGRSWQEAGRRHARMMHIRGAEDWSKHDVAYYILGMPNHIKGTGRRDAANILSSTHASFVTLDAITKVVAKGFEQGSRAANYREIVDMRQVPDFKNYRIGSLGTGNLQQTAEAEAFPELAKSEGVYSNAISMWGGTLSLTYQALVDDDAGEYDRSLRQAGAIADKTINKRVFQKFLMGTSSDTATATWTNNTTSGATIVSTTADTIVAARGNLDTVISAMMTKIGQDGNPLGHPPYFLIVPTALEGQARAITGGIAPGQPDLHTPSGGSLQVVSSVWLDSSSTLTGASATSYYLLADPMEVTGLCVSMLTGVTSPQVQQYDPGAVAAINHKIFLPFEADLFYQANSAGTDIIAAAQQGTT